MNTRLSSTLAFGSTALAAVLAASLMAGSVRAETPTIDNTPFVSTRTRAEVQAEVLADRAKVSSAGIEWAMQQGAPRVASGLTRQQVQAEYIAAREEVHAMNAEDSGSTVARAPSRQRGTAFAGR
jgi:hypothetical protein